MPKATFFPSTYKDSQTAFTYPVYKSSDCQQGKWVEREEKSEK